MIKQWHREAFAWAMETFGPTAADPRERAMRLLEEAIELSQTQGVTRADVKAITERVYSRPAGVATQEVGQVGLTLAFLATNLGQSADRLARSEFDRVRRIPKADWQRRHAAKVAVGAAVRDERAA